MTMPNRQSQHCKLIFHSIHIHPKEHYNKSIQSWSVYWDFISKELVYLWTLEKVPHSVANTLSGTLIHWDHPLCCATSTPSTCPLLPIVLTLHSLQPVGIRARACPVSVKAIKTIAAPLSQIKVQISTGPANHCTLFLCAQTAIDRVRAHWQSAMLLTSTCYHCLLCLWTKGS